MAISSKLEKQLINTILANQSQDHATSIRGNASPDIFLDKNEFYDRGTKIWVTSGLNPATVTTNASGGIRLWNGFSFNNAVPAISIASSKVIRSFYFQTEDTMFVIDISPVNSSRRVYEGVSPYPYIRNIGDRWIEYDSNSNYLESWFWDGTYWLSTEKLTYTQSLNANASTYNPFPFPQIDTSTGIIATNIFFLNWKINAQLPSLSTTANFWRAIFENISNTGTFTTYFTENLDPVTANVPRNIIRNLNFHVDATSSNINQFRLGAIRTGSPPALIMSSLITYRRARI